MGLVLSMLKITINFVSFLFSFSIVACYHDAPEKPKAQIDYPALSAQADFDELQTLDAIDLNNDNSSLLIPQVIPRLLTVTEIANQEADIVAISSARENPTFKAQAQSLNIVSAQNTRCDNDDNSIKNTESLIWDDVNEDGRPLFGDKWYYILENCDNKANGSSITGVYSFTGMKDPFNELDETVNDDELYFTDYSYKFDMQVSHKNGTLVFLQDTEFKYSRQLENSGAEITQLSIQAGSLLGGDSNTERFLFKINVADFISDDDEDSLTVSFDADYYDATDEINGYVNVATVDPLLISYTRINALVTDVQLISGKLLLSDKQGNTVLLTILEDEQDAEIQFDLNADDEIDSVEKIDKQEIINNEVLTLLLLIG